MSLYHGFPVFRRYFIDSLITDNPCVINKHINTPEAIDGGPYDVFSSLLISDAIIVGHGGAAGVFYRFDNKVSRVM